MSNYLFLVHGRHRRTQVDGWLRAHASDSDVRTVALALGRRLVIVSKDVERSIRGDEFFRGVAIASDHGAAVFGINGWTSAPGELRDSAGDHGGEYIWARWDGRHLNIRNDVFGGARLMHSVGRGWAAASDSLLSLTALRRALGERVTLNTEVLVARTALNAVAGQQISPETIINEVAYVPAGFGLDLGRQLEWQLSGTTVNNRLWSPDHDYVDALRSSATSVARIVATLPEVSGWRTTLSLSGGLDSRLVFSAIVATGQTDMINYHSLNIRPAHARDYAVATALAAKHGVRPISQGVPVGEANPNDQLTLWAASLMGVYDGYGPGRTRRWHANTFGMTGIGAEIHKGNWEWRTLPELVDFAAPSGDARDALSAQIDKGAASVGADPTAKSASEVLYLGYRNGIHAAAGHIGVHMTTVHPVMQLALARVAHRREPASESGFLGRPDGIRDLSVLLAPAVAAFEYEDPAWNITGEQAVMRHRELGGRLPPVEPLSIYGHPSDVVDGPSDLSISVARKLGMVGPINASTALDDAPELVAALPAELRGTFEKALANARWRIDKHSGDVRAAEIGPPRITMLRLCSLLS
jgi:hypothetical protein